MHESNARNETVVRAKPGTDAEHVVVKAVATSCAVDNCFPQASIAANARGARLASGELRLCVVHAAKQHLQVCPEPPRPAWFAVNGRRIDRRLGLDYSISFEAPDGRCTDVRDPLQLLVQWLVVVQSAPPRAGIERLADSIALRLRLYAGVLGALHGP